jgi:hypothetical protein
MGPAETAAEARRAGRQRVDAVVPVVNAMTQRGLGLTRDISMGGLQLQAAEPLVDEALYQVQVELQRNDGARIPIEAGVQVVRQYRGPDGAILVGMRFIHLDSANNGRLSSWIVDAAQPR